jgi:hypothetical protein
MKKKLLAVLFLTLACSITAAELKLFRFGTGVRVSSFGIPNVLLDLMLYEHPQLTGTAISFEAYSYGEKGPKSIFSGVYCVEYNQISGNGYWRIEQYHNRVFGSGEVTQINLTASILMHIFPHLPVHPYIGGGIGIGWISIWAEGSSQDELGTTISDTFQKKTIVPVGHIPVGIIGNIDDKYMIRVEGGFKNGFYFGGSFTVNF